MKIHEFIQREVLLPRLQQAGVLVVYDPERRYRELCLGLADERRRVVDASESSIESREAALEVLQEVGRPAPGVEGLLVYVPAAAPRSDIGAAFPAGDGDEYISLCLKARADHATAIRRIFAENPSPDFAVIDAEDIVGRVREAMGVVFSGQSSVASERNAPLTTHHRQLATERIEAEACEILGVKGLREYFARPAGFFADHLARYSKSRRQAPIYWPLSTASGSYTLWLYYHRLSDQTLYSCVNDFVEPKLKVVSDQLAVISQKAGRSAKEEKELERLDALRKELGDLRAELLRVAAFWKPNLNDGVQITAAPLWRLFAHKPWQKRLKETWEQLEKGAYDWAHLAYAIWPERVREKCKADKSLAIAHDLEALYVAPPTSTKKRGRAKRVAAEDDETGEE